MHVKRLQYGMSAATLNRDVLMEPIIVIVMPNAPRVESMCLRTLAHQGGRSTVRKVCPQQKLPIAQIDIFTADESQPK
jgi:hypothetical protein